ncbi:MAG: AGE family epimerase/isomerase [Clostridiales bacterium]|nr:AGE family epimerase/isomerase [Clostridiales bacterium]
MKSTVIKELTENILPFWEKLIDTENGGFYGKADFYGNIDKTADKGGVLNSRILWTFSAAARVTGNKDYLKYASHAFEAFKKFFFDKEYGGVYWLTDYTGKPVEPKKQFYNLAFAIYALTEYYRAAADENALRYAISLYDSLEKHGYEENYGGYIDAKARDWAVLPDTSLSSKDLNCAKSMNTNLHVMEAYTNLLRCFEVPNLREKLKNLITVTMDKIITDGKRFNLFFDNLWFPLTEEVSYGHDIEGSWLLYEAATVCGDCALTERAKQIALKMADWVLENGIDEVNGGLPNSNELKMKEWWPQAEAVVGFYNAYELSGNEKYFKAAADMLNYIEAYFTDKTNGEWHNEVSLNNLPDTKQAKADMWKCPYHNSRMCLEIIERISEGE